MIGSSLKDPVFVAIIGILSMALIYTGSKYYNVSNELKDRKLAYSNALIQAKERELELQAEIKEKETALVKLVEETKKETNEQTKVFTAQRNDLLDRVRRAEARSKARMSSASQDSCDGQTPSGSNGEELLGSFGQEDVEEALRADTIRVELLACYRRYEDVRRMLNQ